MGGRLQHVVMIFVHGSYVQDMDTINHVAAAPGPLACPSQSARPRNYLTSNQTLK